MEYYFLIVALPIGIFLIIVVIATIVKNKCNNQRDEVREENFDEYFRN